MRQRKLRVTSLWFVVLALFIVAAALSLSRAAYWLAQRPRVGRADVIVVLGGGHPQRILHGISLYQQGLAPELWHTGHVKESGRTASFGTSAVQLAVERGVPAEAIHLLPTTSTWEDGQEIKAFAERRQVNSILVVTSWYHSRRALCVIKQQFEGSGVSILYDPPSDLRYGPDRWWRDFDDWAAVLKELVKIGFYWPRYGLAPWRC